MKQKSNYRFLNWAKNESCTARNFFQPETEEELTELIKKSTKVRMVGTGHSWNALCLNNDTLINLDLYNKLLWVNKEKLQVKIQAGMKLWQLNEQLDRAGLALANLGSIAKQSVAGAISTGTHGTGITCQILGSQVEECSLIKASGEKMVLHRERDKDLFNMCLVNLGCLGVISEITLNVIPAFNLRDNTVAFSFEEAIDRLEILVANNRHYKMWWFPHTDKMVVYRYGRTDEAITDSPLRQWFMDEFVSVTIYRLLLKIGTINRKWRKKINALLVLNFKDPLFRIEKSYKVFNVPEPPLHREVEWAFDYADAQNLLREYKQLIDSSNHLINFIQEIRFSKADDFALSGCYGRDTIWLGAYNADNFGWKELMEDFEKLAKKYNGRPHWGKEFTVDKEYLKSVYPKYDDFNTLRKELDPQGKFSNDFISRYFE